MRTQNHTIGRRCIAYLLLFSLFLQNCTNPSLSLEPNKQEAIGDNQLQASVLMERSLQARETPTDLQEPINQKEKLNDGLVSPLQGARSTADQSDKPNLSLPADQQAKASHLHPTHLSPVKSNHKLVRNKPTVNSLQGHKRLTERQQVKSSSTSCGVEKASQRSKQADKKAPLTRAVVPFQLPTPDSKQLVTKGRYQIAFEKTATGQWKAAVNESFQVGISRRIELPVFFELGYQISHVADRHLVHVIEQGTRSFIWVGSVGIKGGMYQQEEDDNSNSNSNSNNSKAEVMTEVIPSDLSGKLKYLYQQDDTLPKLIEDEDEKIKEERIQDYYVKLQVVLQEDIAQGRSAAARDQVVGEKKPVEVDKLFDEIDKDHPAVSKVLLLGGAGIGKSTLMHYISYQWAQGKLWKDKYEHVFRVRLKDLLDPTWAKKATKSDLLARFIYSCLDRQKTALAVKGNEQLDEMGYDLDEIQQLLKDPSKKEKVLLLVDGYDEITSLKGKPEYQKIVDLGIFKHPKVIMTSRPNAASKEIRAKFERQVESQRLDEAGINQYINLQFKQAPALAQGLKDFLVSNSQVRSMCEVPINTALLCITWKDPTVSTKLTSSTSIETDFKLGQLYHELIVWLGKRYAIKYNSVLEEEVFKVLERIAYQSFTGIGLEDQARQGGTLGIPGQLVAKLAKKEGKLSLSQLHQYGLLRGEGDTNKPLEQVYYFIHLTFQEYLTAHRLCKLLSQENKAAVAQAATWIAHHRNDPKYLMTFKFLAGLVSQSKDEVLVRRFWEAMSCNVDGVIELGVEGKVKLFMHLLSQSKIGGDFDNRIPNLKKIKDLVDGTLQKDLVKWEQAIIEAGYYPTWLQEAASKVLEKGIESAKEATLKEESLSHVDRIRSQAAANLLSKIVNQGGTLPREQLFDQFMELIALKYWHLQKLGLEKAREVVDKTVSARKIEASAKNIVELLRDENLQEAAIVLFTKLCQITQPVFKQIKPLLADSDEDVRRSAANALKEIVKLVPELRKEVWKELKPLLANSDEDVRRSAANALKEIVKLVPGLEKKVWKALKPLLAHSDEDVRRSAASALKEIVPLALVPLSELVSLLADANPNVRQAVKEALIAKFKSPEKIDHQELDSLMRLVATQQSAQEELDKELYVAGHQALQRLAGTLDSQGIQWLNEHLAELRTLPVVQTFLKAVIAKTLEEGMLDLQAAALLIKRIVARGLTATINPQANQIILEDNTYTLQPTAQGNLTYVVNEVIRLSTDPMAQQYKDHKPLFENSGEALPLATADIKQVGSILDKEPLNSESWRVSVLDLSDHHQSKPSTTFILLEQRNYVGQHVIHQLKLHQGEGKVSSYAMNPLAVDEIKQKVFGQLYVMKEPRCYAYSFTLSQKLGEQLVEKAQQIKTSEKGYETWHNLAVDYQVLQANRKRKASDLLSLPWGEYRQDPTVKQYEEEQLCKKEVGSGVTNVYANTVNVETMINVSYQKTSSEQKLEDK